jgi:ketopantoate hydroxymethyltransferase
VRNFLEPGETIESAVRRYVSDVKESRFPDDAQHGF